MEGVRSAIFEITQLLNFSGDLKKKKKKKISGDLSSEDLLLQKVSQV